MRIKTGAFIICLAAGPLWAETPLSAIDWLEDTPTVKAALPTPSQPQKDEPKTTATALAPSVTTQALGTAAPRTLGLIPSSVTGLPQDLWTGTSSATTARRLSRLPDITLPALQSMLFAMMLTETAPMKTAAQTDQLTKARIDYLVKQGALDPAVDLLAQTGATRSPSLAGMWFDLSLLAGLSDESCAAVLKSVPGANTHQSRIYCLARSGKWDDAALLLNSGAALELIAPYDARLLTHFLDPETAEEEQTPSAPQTPTALQFTLLAALGEPVPTRSLPRIFANADLGDQAGWKPEILAAERLAQSGALPANRLLGIYTERQPAASGGLWDRVEALQQFEVALRTRSPNAISKTLPAVWSEMQSAGLGAVFANLFAADLAGLPLEDRAAAIAFDVAMVSPDYKTLVTAFSPSSPSQQLLASVALGTPYVGANLTPVETAVHDALKDPPPENAITQTAKDGQLGVALLMAIARIQDGANGDLEGLTVGLSSLRALGRDSDARRAALQVLILDRS